MQPRAGSFYLGEGDYLMAWPHDEAQGCGLMMVGAGVVIFLLLALAFANWLVPAIVRMALGQ